MEHKRLCHMGEGVKAKKVTSSGVRVRSRDTCARETGLLDEVQAQRERRGADDAALLSDIGRFFSATAASVGIDALSPTEHRPPFPSFTEQTWGTTQTARRSIPFSHTKPEKHEDRFNTFQLIPQRDQRKSFRFFKKHKG